jgi:hypothetical protein
MEVDQGQTVSVAECTRQRFTRCGPAARLPRRRQCCSARCNSSTLGLGDRLQEGGVIPATQRAINGGVCLLLEELMND